MTDIISRHERSALMARIRSRDTAPELTLRRHLHRAGFRFRLHQRNLPGRPDIVLARYRAAIFVHGCFWHGHAGCPLAYVPKTRTEFWREKFEVNQQRDDRQAHLLSLAGWRVLIVWECGLRDSRLRQKTVADVEMWLRSDAKCGEVPVSVERALSDRGQAG